MKSGILNIENIQSVTKTLYVSVRLDFASTILNKINLYHHRSH